MDAGQGPPDSNVLSFGGVSMKVKFSSLAALTVCLLFLACGAFADSIPVTNFSFETHPPFNNSDGTGQWTDGLPIPGWTITGSGGVWMPSNLNRPAYDGNVLAWSNGGSFFQSVGATTAGAMRSEERRVGKEGRSRWAPHL